MIKKISISVFMLLLFLGTNIYAGDIPESIMSGSQKALFIGKIISINTDAYTIIPSKIMMGNIQQSELQIKKFDKYYGTSDKPKIGDFIVAILLDEKKIDESRVFKSSSEDYKTLKLVSEQYDMVVRYEQYINEGKYLEAQKRIDDNKKTSITSTENSVDDRKTVTDVKEERYQTSYLFVLFLIIIVSGSVILFSIRSKNSHKR